MKTAEFSGDRSRSYKEALSKFPKVWEEDKLLLDQYFAPQEGEKILEIGAGSGFFSFQISDRIGDNGHLFVVDPSSEQLEPIRRINRSNITVIENPAEDISLEENCLLDGVWSRGAFHHASDKQGILSNLSKHCRKGARLAIVDIFVGSPLAKYFDLHVAKTCKTGHEVSFLSKEFGVSICKNSGWKTPTFYDIALQWRFSQNLRDAELLLGIKKTPDGWALNWPMTIMTSTIE